MVMIQGRFIKDGHCTEVVINGDFVRSRRTMIPKFINAEKLMDDLNNELSQLTSSWLATNRELEMGCLIEMEKAIAIANAQEKVDAFKVRHSCETCRYRRKHWESEPCASCSFDGYDGSEWESIRGIWKIDGAKYRCSECGCKMDKIYNYCPDCGSPMEVL